MGASSRTEPPGARLLFSMRTDNPTIIFDPDAGADQREIVQAIVSDYNVALTGHTEWYPVAFFLKDENGEVLGGLLGDIWAAWLHVKTLAVVAPAGGHGFGKELMKRAELYAVERGCTNAFLDTFSFQARPFYEKLGYRLWNAPVQSPQVRPEKRCPEPCGSRHKSSRRFPERSTRELQRRPGWCQRRRAQPW
jgi:GNAT superfamily N-acetyltransferase